MEDAGISDPNFLLASVAFGVILAAIGGIQKWRRGTANIALRQFWTTPLNQELCKIDHPSFYDRAEDDFKYLQNRDRGRTFDQEFPEIKYETLDDKVPQMRLLVLHPPRGNDDQLFCSLQKINLNETARTPYTALSYTWGSEKDKAIIFVNNRPVEVRRNLHDALIKLRRRNHTRVWNDYLCIKQSDIHGERRQQLLQMHSIYGLAKTVIAWLGDSDELSEAFVDTLQRVSKFRENIGQTLHISTGNFMFDLSQMWMKDQPMNARLFPHIQRLRRNLGQGFLSLLDKFQPEFSNLQWNLYMLQLEFLRQVESLVQRDYWRRAWIIQELTAASTIKIWCGKDEIDYTIFMGLLKDMESLHLAQVSIPFTPLHEQILKLDQLKGKWRRDEPIHLLEAFRDTYYARSGRKHDEIYAILNIGFNKNRYVPVLDYHVTMELLITQMTELRVRSTKSLDLICMRSLTKSAFVLPSWAPDWRLIGKHAFNDRMMRYLTGQDEHAKIDARSKQWSATSDSQCTDVEFTDNGKLMRVRYWAIGDVVQLVPPASQLMEVGAQPKATESTVRGLVAQFCSDDVNPIASNIFDLMTVYKEADPLEDEKCDWNSVFDSTVLKEMYKSRRKVYTWLMTHRGMQIRGRTLEAWSKGVKWDPFELLDALSDSLKRGVNRLTRHRPVGDNSFLPSTPLKRSIVSAVCRVIEDDLSLVEIVNKYQESDWGWAHPLTEVGDKICLLEGCSVPVILRATGKTWEGSSGFEVVGDAYITGAMSGELWPKAYRQLEHIYLS